MNGTTTTNTYKALPARPAATAPLPHNDACPHGEPTCWGGFECERCTFDAIIASGATPGPLWAGSLASAEDPFAGLRSGSGSGSGSRSFSSSSSSEVRWGKWNDEWALRCDDASVLTPGAEVTVTKKNGETQTQTVGAVLGRQGGATYASVARSAAPAAADGETGRWAKHNGAWAIRTRLGALSGATVTVTKANGETQEHTLGRCLATTADSAIWEVARQEPAVAAEGVALSPGFWVTEDDRIWKVQEARSSDRLYAKLLTGSTFDYAPGGLATLRRGNPRKLTLAEAAAFGHRTGRCMCCGRELTDPSSITAGVGPVCAERLSA